LNAALPARFRVFAPKLAKLGEAPPQGEQWLHEIKSGKLSMLTLATPSKVSGS
jgi:bifunctional non-homologous end joining protein LigD